MININKNTEWKLHKTMMEKAFKDIGEHPRITRSNRNTEDNFEAVVLEGGLNIKYNLRTEKITIWGVGKRYSNGYISYEDLVAKTELFIGMMKECVIKSE